MRNVRARSAAQFKPLDSFRNCIEPGCRDTHVEEYCRAGYGAAAKAPPAADGVAAMGHNRGIANPALRSNGVGDVSTGPERTPSP